MALAKVFGIVLMVVCFIALHADAAFTLRPLDFPPFVDEDDANDYDDTRETDAEEGLPEDEEIELEYLLVAVAALSEEIVVPAGFGIAKRCKCTGLTCKCCQNVKVKNSECCLNMAYDPAGKTVSMSVTFAGKTVYEKKFPVSDPPELCSNLSMAKICLNFYDFKVDAKKFTGCTRISMYFGAKLGTYDLGCFDMKLPVPAQLLPPMSRSTSKPTPKPKSKPKG